MHKIKEGDIVWLKSGGPKMTVKQIEDEKVCKCIWFQYGEIQTHDFVLNTLTTEDPFVFAPEFEHLMVID